MTSRKTTTSMSPDELREQLLALQLHHLAEDLDDFLARATQARWGPQVLVEQLVRQELAVRERRSLERRLKNAKLGPFKPMAGQNAAA